MAEDDRTPTVRKGQGSTKLTKEEFQRRVRERFSDPEFESVSAEVDRIIDVAWTGYDKYRKNPRTRKAGSLDRAEKFFEEVRNAARSLLVAVQDVRAGRLPPDHGVHSPRPK